MFLSSNFWPLFWAVIGGGVAAALLLALVVAGRTLPGEQTEQPSGVIEQDPQDGEEALRHMRAA